MKTKFYVLNKQDPSKTDVYRNPHDVAIFMLGRRLSNYVVIVETKDGETILVNDLSPIVSEIETKLSEYL